MLMFDGFDDVVQLLVLTSVQTLDCRFQELPFLVERDTMQRE